MLSYLIFGLVVLGVSLSVEFLILDGFMARRKYALFAKGEVLFFKSLDEMKLKVKADYEFEDEVYQYVLVDDKYIRIKQDD